MTNTITINEDGSYTNNLKIRYILPSSVRNSDAKIINAIRNFDIIQFPSWRNTNIPHYAAIRMDTFFWQEPTSDLNYLISQVNRCVANHLQ